MKTVKIAELKDKLSEHLRAVEAGEVVVVTDRNRPIARLMPMDTSGPALAIDEPSTSFQIVRARKWPAARWRLSATELLDAERRDA
jgi:prevent-host-death family protein